MTWPLGVGGADVVTWPPPVIGEPESHHRLQRPSSSVCLCIPDQPAVNAE